MYVEDDDNTFDTCWYVVQIIEKQVFYAHKVSRREKVTKFIWSHRKTKAIRFLTIKGLSRFIKEYNLTNKKYIFVLVEQKGKDHGILPADTVIEN